MIVRLIVFIFLSLQYAYSSESSVYEGDTTFFVGLIGPQFVVQHGLNLQLTHQFSKTWSIDVETGGYSTNSNSPAIETSYVSLGISTFLNQFESITNLFNLKAPLFIRSSYSYHDDLNVISRSDIILGRRISHGFEISPGVRVTRGWYSLEIIPLSLYFPVQKRESRDIPVINVFDRILSLKFGLTF